MPEEVAFPRGYNLALRRIDEYELSEEELTKIININSIGTTDRQDRALAKAIKANQSKIFVRKNK